MNPGYGLVRDKETGLYLPSNRGGIVPPSPRDYRYIDPIIHERRDVAYAWIKDNGATGDGGATTITVQLTTVTAGSKLVALAGHEGASTTVSMSDGTTSLTGGTYVSHTNGDLHGRLFYLLSSVASGTVTYTVTFAASRPFRRVIIMEFSGGTSVFDTQNTAQGTSATATSGAITTTGATELVVCGVLDYAASTFSNEAIFGTGATNIERGHYATLFWRSATAAGGTATASLSGGGTDWISLILALKEQAATGTRGLVSGNLIDGGILRHGLVGAA